MKSENKKIKDLLIALEAVSLGLKEKQAMLDKAKEELAAAKKVDSCVDEVAQYRQRFLELESDVAHAIAKAERIPNNGAITLNGKVIKTEN